MTTKVEVGSLRSSRGVDVTGPNSRAIFGGTTQLTADGTFATSTGWTLGSGWTIAADKASHATGSTAALSGTSTANSTSLMYEVLFTLTTTTPGTGLRVSLGGTSSLVTYTASNTYAAYMRPGSSSGTLTFTPQTGGTWVGDITAVAIYTVYSSDPDVIIRNSDGNSSNTEIRSCGDGLNSLAVGSGSGKYLIGSNCTYLGFDAGSQSVTADGVTAIGRSYLEAGIRLLATMPCPQT
jgi:hypothetical protein